MVLIFGLFWLKFKCIHGIISLLRLRLKYRTSPLICDTIIHLELIEFTNIHEEYNCKQMQKWHENKALLNILIVLMTVCFIAYYLYHWYWGLPLFLTFGTAIMIRGVTKITMRMRENKTKPDSQNKEIS